MRSTSAVHTDLATLEREGFIRRDPAKPRAIEVHGDRQAVRAAEPPLTGAALLRGPITAGSGVLPDDQVEQMLPLPRELVGDGELVALRVRNNSMIEGGILEGDFVVVRRHAEVGNGDIVAALVRDAHAEQELTVTRWCRRDGRTRLVPANPADEPIDGEEATVVGRVVAVFRRL